MPLLKQNERVTRMIMKAMSPLAVFAALLMTQPAQAHNRFEIDVGAGVRVGGSGKALIYDAQKNATEGKLRIDPAFSMSGMLGYRTQPNSFLYLLFSRQVANTHLDTDDQKNFVQGKLAIEYYQFGGNVEFTSGHWVPYFGASVGVSRWVSLGGGGSRLFFTAGLDAGIKLDLHEHVHLRLAARMPVTMSHGDIYCLAPSDCVELRSFSPIIQGEGQLGIGVSF